MSRQLKNFLIKTLSITSVIVILFTIGNSIINANTSQETVETNNKNVFKNINSKDIGKTSVAISTNIGLKLKQRSDVPANIYSGVFSISELVNNESTNRNDLIGSNMIQVEEYRNILKSDFKNIIKSTDNKADMIDAIIDQLEYRYSNSVSQIEKLKNQKTILQGEMGIANSKITEIKQKISSDYKNRNALASEENIKNYLEVKNNFYYARTYIIYINQFLTEYITLNNYNKKLLDTLINNKEALIKETQVVIPDSGASLLKDFDLLYTEEEFKNK